MESQIPELSVDILELIIDFLVHDNGEEGILYAKICSLACKALLPLCRRHIFRSVEFKLSDTEILLDSEGNSDAGDGSDAEEDPDVQDGPDASDEDDSGVEVGSDVEDGSDASDDQDYSDPEEGSDVQKRRVYWDSNSHLLFQTPAHAKYVQFLKIEWQASRQTDSLGDSPVDLSHLSRVVEHLTSLKSLKIWSYYYAQVCWRKEIPLPFQNFVLDLMHLPTITELELGRISDFCMSDLVPCVHLRKLTISDVFIRTEDNIPPLSTNPIALQEFDVGNDYIGAQMIREARRSDGRPVVDLTHLRKIRVYIGEVGDAEFIREILESARGLESIRLSICDDPEVDFKIIKFSQMIAPCVGALSEMRFGMTRDVKEKDPLCGLCDELKMIVGRNKLRKLGVETTLYAYDGWDAGDEWGQLEKVLLEPDGWPMLESVSLHIVVCTRSDVSEMVERLRNRHFAGLVSSEQIDLRFLSSYYPQ